MSPPLLYIDSSDVRGGALAQLKAAISELAEFVRQNEPEIISYNVYFGDEDRRMTVVHEHPDSASLDLHMEVAGPRFGAFADLLTLKSIDIYGVPSSEALAALQDKMQRLGSGYVRVHTPHAGFSRFQPA
jgi:hypothetical protein